ncbi:PLC-like phosphodiesterase [Coniochaeta ligniaria NRRL 30616]|uniref:Phosphoinositide phospholipase C n=1 Tax=Coniochaeta ligniaria NRRL 30616 TaxID=1408157 RepID=A0A1J7IR44_9PEZI|nr:PLC-like phosphodiesterase [Coniochaeta ligniaria NRRL 30616]
MSVSENREPSPNSSALPLSIMSQETLPGRRSRPSQLQTNLPSQLQLAAIPASAASSSSAASNAEHMFPVLPSEQASTLGGLTIQPSPESLRGRDLEVSVPPPFQLPDAVLSRRRSSNSLTQSTVTSPGSTAQEPVRAPNMMRRFSNKVSAFTGSMGSALGSSARRQSSVHPISRDGSVGPSVIRNRLRSNSNNSAIAPPDNAFYSDSEDDVPNDNDVPTSFYGGDATSLPDDRGPTIPQALEHGTWISKLSKKKKPKRIFLTLDPDAAKIYWDKNSPAKWVYLDDIKEVRTGGDLSQYRATFNAPDSYETRGFSLIVATSDKGKNRMIHLVAEDEKSLHDWTTAIERLMKHREDFTASLMAFDDDAVQAFWETEMTRKLGDTPKNDADRRIDLQGLKNICRNLHIHLPENTMLERFSEAMAMNEELRANASLDRRGFMAFVQLVKTRMDIQPIYQQFASSHKLGLTLEDFYRFLRESQGENIDEESAHWKAVFDELLRKAKSRSISRLLDDQPRLSEAAFASFFATDANALPRETDVVQSVNLDRPMNEYYISSSHNTYLLGYQVRGESSVEGYISALSRGCRCVEIDCWDGPRNNDPVVMHGHSLTTQISFREVINTINKYAFVKSNYPLWISLEVRCGWVTQENMVKIMLDTFGDKLVLQPIDSKSDRLPSPSQLMGRILIKVKKPQGGDELRRATEIIGRRRGNSFTSPLQRPTSMDNGSLPGSPLLSPSGIPSRKTSTRINTITEGRVPEAAPSSSTSEQDSDSDKDSTKKVPSKINPILGNMGVYAAGITFNGFDTPEARVYNHIFSFKEKTFRNNDTPKERKRALFRHNMRYMMRVYPDATRFTSSNFNPLIYWKRGVQMSALNWQTFDLGMQINQAMFECGTDQTGYVLKSKGLREIQMIPNGPGEWATKRERKNVKLNIEVISAQQLLRPFNLEGRRTLDPYVEVELFLPDDKKHKGESAGGQNTLKLHTKIVRGNGFNPSFGDKLEFPDVQTKYPDLVFVRWTVKLADKNVSDRAQVLGTFMAKLEHLKKGYRTLPLLDHNGDRYLFSTLFCRINYDVTSIFVPAPTDDAEGGNSRFRVVRPSFLNRSNLSPKTSQDSGLS